MAAGEHSFGHADGRAVPPSVVLFTVGQLAVLLAVPRGAPLALLVAAEAAVSLPLVVSLLGVGLRATGVFTLVAIALGALVFGGLRALESLWLAALVVVPVVATLTYGLHRYERVVLGLVREGSS
jgi:uncharacterized protein (DUF983 family)